MVVPRDVIAEKFSVPKLVKSYSRIPDVLPLPNLIQIQLQSYEIFKREGLRELLDEISPIQDFTGNRLEMRFAGYITVSGASLEELDRSCSDVEHSAQLARLELQRLYGEQDAGFTFTLPLCRGLA
jgi:DNA-directed RNA polymerase beta subunit